MSQEKNNRTGLIALVAALIIFVLLAAFAVYSLIRANAMKDEHSALLDRIDELELSIEDALARASAQAVLPGTEGEDNTDDEVLSMLESNALGLTLLRERLAALEALWADQNTGETGILDQIAAIDEQLARIEASVAGVTRKINTLAESANTTFTDLSDDTIPGGGISPTSTPASTPTPTPEATPEPSEEPGEDYAGAKKGDTFVVNVYAARTTDLYGYEFVIRFDKNTAAYANKMQSKIVSIPTIFPGKSTENLLVGATMMGKVPGYNGTDVYVCQITFTALQDMADFSSIGIRNVKTVNSRQEDTAGVSGWTVKCERVK